MRKALNQNRVVQITALGVLFVLGGLMLMLTSGGKSSTSASTTGSTVATTPGATAPSTGSATTGAAPTGTDPAAPATSAAPVSATAPTVPGPPLPGPVQAAIDHNKAVVLLVVRAGGIDDRLVRESVSRLSSGPAVEVFVTRALHIARYARITQGVNVDRVPALVVVRPRSLSGGVPAAEVHYGFRDAASVVQAVRDALYVGPTNVPYHPG